LRENKARYLDAGIPLEIAILLIYEKSYVIPGAMT